MCVPGSHGGQLFWSETGELKDYQHSIVRSLISFQTFPQYQRDPKGDITYRNVDRGMLMNRQKFRVYVDGSQRARSPGLWVFLDILVARANTWCRQECLPVSHKMLTCDEKTRETSTPIQLSTYCSFRLQQRVETSESRSRSKKQLRYLQSVVLRHGSTTKNHRPALCERAVSHALLHYACITCRNSYSFCVPGQPTHMRCYWHISSQSKI